MAPDKEDVSSQDECKYCRKAVTSCLKCCECGAIYHPSCALRTSGCYFKCCKSERKKNDKLGVSAEKVEEKSVDFSMEAFTYLKLLVEEQTVTNNLLREKINYLEKELESEKSKGKSTEDKYNELLKKEDKKHSVSDKHQKNVNLNKNINIAEAAKKGSQNTVNPNMKTMATQQQQIMNSYININSDISGQENEEESKQCTGNSDNKVNNKNYEFKTVTYKQKRQKNGNRNNICHGTNMSEDESSFKGVDKKLWLYVYRVPRQVTENNVINFISKKPSFKNLKIDAKELPTNENQNKVFLVTAPFEKKEEMYQPDFWPKGVAVKRFDFNRQKRYNQNSFL